MGRRKAAQNCEILPWLSGKTNNKEGRFIQVGNSLLLNETLKRLKPGAWKLYICMAMEAGGKNIFAFPHKSAVKYGISRSSFDNYAKDLINSGLIEKVPQDEQYVPAIFRFTTGWK